MRSSRVTTHAYPTRPARLLRPATILVVGVVLLTAGCNPAAPPTGSTEPGPYVSEHPDRSVTLDHPVTSKTHYPPNPPGDLSPGHKRWEFCFDPTDSGWMCIPVSAEDYRRHEVGDRVLLRQEVGKVAVIASH